MIVYTCGVCETRGMKTFSKHAYHKGVVIVRCDSCKSLHLVADNLHWTNALAEPTNIEQMMEKRGIKVPRLSGADALEFVLTKAEQGDARVSVAGAGVAAEAADTQPIAAK